MTRSGHRSTAGETLVELLISISILGIAGAGVIGVVMMGTSASVLHGEMTAASRMLRNWAESLQRTPYGACATRTAVSLPPEPGGWAGSHGVFTRTIKGVTYTASVVDVRYWLTDNTDHSRFVDDVELCERVGDSGLQQLRLQMEVEGTGMEGTTEDLLLTKRNPCRSIAEEGCS